MPRIKKPFFRNQRNTWYARFEGKVISLGVVGHKNEKDAIKAWHQLMANGPKTKQIASGAYKTVRDLFDGFIEDAEERLTNTSVSLYGRFLMPFARRHGKCSPTDVNAKQVHAFANRPTWANTTRHMAITTIATAFRWGKVPLEGLRIPPKESKGMEAIISEEDAQAIIQLAQGDMSHLLRFLWLTGCRPSEAMSLKKEMVDLKNSIIVLKDHKTVRTTKKARYIYLSPESKVLVEEQMQKNSEGELFKNAKGKPFSLKAAVKNIWRFNKKLGTKITLYGFRHSFATEGLARGLPDSHVAELLGHTSTKMLHAHYSHLGAKASLMREAATKVRQ